MPTKMAVRVGSDILVRLTDEQHRYVMTSLYRMSRQDRRGKEKIERKFQQPVKDASLLKRLELADSCIDAFTLETNNGNEPVLDGG